ncbi:MAG: hypothetical protein H7Y42_11600 [Chitinophagaceae bacterium]|nr:hypothetical protein [Chitinophagaceae bacterium]
MRITSKLTYVLPILMLFVSAAFFSFNVTSVLVQSWLGYETDTRVITTFVIIAIAFAVVLYFLFRKQALSIGYRHFKYVLIFLPYVFELIRTMSGNHPFQFVFPLFSGLLFYYTFELFANRYTAILTDSSIEYSNLFGQRSSIPLTAVTKLEEKRNILSFLRELKILEIAPKLAVAFCDENLDEYEVKLFLRMYNKDKIFTQIIERSNKVENFKIRQYSL